MDSRGVPSDFVVQPLAEQKTPNVKLPESVLADRTQATSSVKEEFAYTPAEKQTAEKISAMRMPVSLIASRKHPMPQSPTKKYPLKHPNPRMFEMYQSHPSKAMLETSKHHDERESVVAFD